MAAAAAALVTTGLVSCGDESAQPLAFKIGFDGFIQGPPSANPGLTEMTFENVRGTDADMQLIRAEGNRSPAEVTRALTAATRGKPLPDWFHAAGGVGSISRGESATVTQVLEPGVYFAFNTETNGPPSPLDGGKLEVKGEATDDELDGDAKIAAIEYGFEDEGLTSGKTEVLFENKGAQPHHLIASPLIGDATAEEVEAFFKTEKGKPPLSEKGTVSTAVLEGGEGQAVTLDLKPGRYAFYCFITDRQGGPPHALKGMVDEFEVE